MRSLYLAPGGCVPGRACMCVCVCTCVHVYVGIGAYRCAHGGWLQVFICHYMHGRVDVDASVVAAACACRAMHMCLLGQAGRLVHSIVGVPSTFQ